MRRVLKVGAIVIAVLFVVMQFVPYGRNHDNPPTTLEAPWPSAEARSIAVTSCYDCHSNRTNWRWYTFVAPFSWLVYRDVKGGRDKVNFTEWDRGGREDELAEPVEEGEMPDTKYTLIHPGAKLSAHEKQVLVAALHQLEDGQDGGRRGRGRGGGD